MTIYLVIIGTSCIFLIGFILGWFCKLDSQRIRDNRLASIVRMETLASFNMLVENIEKSDFTLIKIKRSKRGTFKK